jgi:hypothetical protein
VRTALRRVPFRGIPKSADFFLTSTHFVWSLRNRKKIEGIIFYRLQTQCL